MAHQISQKNRRQWMGGPPLDVEPGDIPGNPHSRILPFSGRMRFDKYNAAIRPDINELGEYLLAASRRPWKDGEHDCTAWPARWAGIPLPDDYSTHGRPLSDVWGDWIGDQLEMVTDPAPGDVGVLKVVTPDGIGEVGGIYTGERWAMLTHKGLALVRLPACNVVAVWRRG